LRVGIKEAKSPRFLAFCANFPGEQGAADLDLDSTRRALSVILGPVDWQATIIDDRVITFRALTGIYKGGALAGDREDWIEAGEEWAGRAFEDWREFLRAHGRSSTIRVHQDGSVSVPRELPPAQT